jgi:hypothetical protein
MTQFVQVTPHGSARLFTFDADRFALGVRPIAGREPGIVEPIAPADALKLDPRAVAAFNGPQFAFAPGDGHRGDDGDQGYRTAKFYRATMLHRDIARGIDIPSSAPDEGITIAVVNGKAGHLAHANVPDDATVAIQLYPALVFAGKPVDVREYADRTGRGALLLMPDGRIGVIGGAMGMHALRDLCVAVGAVAAGYLDGGGSWCDEVVGAGVYGGVLHRRVASYVLVIGDDLAA